MLEPTTLHLHTRFQIGEVDPRVFGGFLEHIGRAVYQGVYEPDSPHADEHGFRQDVSAALARLRLTAMRYPGGNFASGYHWLDGVGPRGKRPAVRELAWQSLEPNHFGTDEFIALCRQLDWTPMLTVNLGTGTPEEARNWVEYCNCPPGSLYADMRAANGSPEPHAVKLWCLGNEMDGPWQLGHVPAEHYAIRAQQAGKMMKDTDRSLELVACGSCSIGMGTYMEWDRQVLEYLGDLSDYVSLHRYVGSHAYDTADYLAVTNSIDHQIEEMDAVCRFVQAKRRSKKRAYLCFDEWNVWYKNHQTDGAGKFAPPLVEEIYNLEDALVVAGFLHSFVRHADVLRIANLAQIVNVIAPLLTQGDQLLIQPTFYPLEMFAQRRHGISLQLETQGPRYEGRTHGPAAYIDASAILDGDRLHLFATNRSLDQAAPLRLHLADRAFCALESGEVLGGPDPKAVNTFAQPGQVVPRPFAQVRIEGNQACCELPPLSVAALTLKLA
ncbi:MAG: alpha-N-arabinofuranosidase [Candidatus Latescibacteria bacterium]|nr:alpha-N-arabinofuranosidase [Candidatus Latescibacterota bacterium]